jgi:hypothetical protein
MTPDALFGIANLTALATWIALAALPGVRWIPAVLAPVVVPAVLAGLYLVLIVTNWGGPGGFATLGDVAMLLSNPWLLLAGWVHYLAFDLIVGSWEVRDARERGVPHWAVLPCLVLTFLFGPAGWLLYLIVRKSRHAG